MNVEWLGPLPNQNFAPGRGGNAVELIVDHWMAGSFEAALAHFRNPNAGVSAHYLVGLDGRVAMVVPEYDTAYHAGNLDVNLRSIGIEHEASPTVAPTPELYAASAWLHADISRRRGIPLRLGVSAMQPAATVLPHQAIVPTQCPGTLDLARIIQIAQGGDMISLFAQSSDLQLVVGQVGILSAQFSYAGGSPVTVQRKVYAPTKTGRYFVEIRPPADPLADPTESLGEAVARFVVDVRAS